MRTGILDSPHVPSIPHIAMDYFNWDFADAPAGDTAEENRAHFDGNPGGIS